MVLLYRTPTLQVAAAFSWTKRTTSHERRSIQHKTPSSLLWRQDEEHRIYSSPSLQHKYTRNRGVCFVSASSNEKKQATTKKGVDNKNNKTSKKFRLEKRTESVNELVSKIGLTPVVANKPDNKKKASAAKKTATTISNTISLQTHLDYARNGHAVLRNFVDPQKLESLRQVLLAHGQKHELKAWIQKVEVAAGVDVAKTCRTLQDCQDELNRLKIPTEDLPFLQYFNTWRQFPNDVLDMALELAEPAAKLLDVPSVRLYQDSFFWKRAQDGATPWHTDARMAPFDTSSLVTFWIPLHDIPRDGTGLHFVSKSHADFALPFWCPYREDNDNDDDDDYNSSNNKNPWMHLEERYQHNKIVHYMPMAIGDITAHSGWTLHCADGKTTNDRLALAISFVDARAAVRHGVLTAGDHGDDEDKWSYADWVKEVPAGVQNFEHNLVPILWPRD